MSEQASHPFRNTLREAYDPFAQERDTDTIRAWKIPERADWLAQLQREGKRTLLEIGAGPGHDSLFFQSQGLEPVCVDLSPAMVALCQQKGLTAYVMDMSDLQFAPGSFDAVYAMNSLLHLPKAEVPAVLRQVEQVLKADGLVYIGVYGGYDYEGVWERDHYVPQRFFSFFSDEALQACVTAVFDLVSFHCVWFENDDIHFQSLLLKKKAPAPTHP